MIKKGESDTTPNDIKKKWICCTYVGKITFITKLSKNNNIRVSYKTTGKLSLTKNRKPPKNKKKLSLSFTMHRSWKTVPGANWQLISHNV